MKHRYFLAAGLIALTVIATTVVFSLNLYKAKQVYEENLLYDTGDLSVETDGLFMYFIYATMNDIKIETRTFSGVVKNRLSIATTNPAMINTLLDEYNNLHIVWVSNNEIKYFLNGKTTTIAVESLQPNIFKYNKHVYITWLTNDGSLKVKIVGTETEWIVAQFVSEYSIYNYQSQKVFICYTSAAIVKFRVFENGLWADEKEISTGTNAHAIYNGQYLYVYCEKDDELICYFGTTEIISSVQHISPLKPTGLFTEEDIVAFSTSEGVFFQKINTTGFSNTVLVSDKETTQVKCRYVDEDDLLFVYRIQETFAYKMVSTPTIDNHQIRPVMLDITSSIEDPAKKSAFEYIADYNSRVFGGVNQTGRVRNFILDHSGESLIFLGLFIVLLITTLTIFLGRKKQPQATTTQKKKTVKKHG